MLSGMGRSELEKKYLESLQRIKIIKKAYFKVKNQRNTYLTNLTSVQERCTELIKIVRYYRKYIRQWL